MTEEKVVTGTSSVQSFLHPPVELGVANTSFTLYLKINRFGESTIHNFGTQIIAQL